MDLCNKSSYVAKTLMLDITLNYSADFFFILAVLVGSIDFYHFIPLYVTGLYLGRDHKVCAK